MDDSAQHFPAGSLHLLPPEVRFMIYGLTLESRTLRFDLEGRAAQLRVCQATALAFRYMPVIAHVCAEMRTYVFGNSPGEARYTPVSFEYHVLAARLGPDCFDVVERLVTGPSMAAAGVAPDDMSQPWGFGWGHNRMDVDSNHSGSENGEHRDPVVFFDDYHVPTPSDRPISPLLLRQKDAPLFTPTSVRRGNITCFAGSSRRSVRGVFSPKIDRLDMRPHRLSRLNIIANPSATDLVHVESLPPIRLLSHRRTPLRSAFTRYLQAKADDFVQQHEDKTCQGGGNGGHLDCHSGKQDTDDLSSGKYANSTRETRLLPRAEVALVEDHRTTAGRYQIITVPGEVAILREVPWEQLPRARFDSLRR